MLAKTVASLTVLYLTGVASCRALQSGWSWSDCGACQYDLEGQAIL